MKNLFKIFLSALFLINFAHAQNDESIVSDDFISYMKSVMNPFDFGLNKETQIYMPYSSRYGRCIGFEKGVEDIAYYSKGMTVSDAEKRLIKKLKATIAPLSDYLKKNYKLESFDNLTVTQREILLDRAYESGINNMPKNFVEAVLKQDWQNFVAKVLYNRAPEGWPDAYKNKAFGYRWVNNKKGNNLLGK